MAKDKQAKPKGDMRSLIADLCDGDAYRWYYELGFRDTVTVADCLRWYEQSPKEE